MPARKMWPPLGDAEEADVGRDEAEEAVGLAADEEAEREAFGAVLDVAALEGLAVQLVGDAVDEGAVEAAALVEDVDAGGRREQVAGVALERAVGRDELGDEHDAVEREDAVERDERGLVAAELGPGDLAAREDEAAFGAGQGVGLDDRHARRLSWPRLMRTRGSSRVRRMSDMTTPITVRTPRSIRQLAATKVSWATMARRSSGPMVGRPRTMATMVEPETMSGSRWPAAEIERVEGDAEGVLEDQAALGDALGARGDDVLLLELVEELRAQDADGGGGAGEADDDHRHRHVQHQVAELGPAPGRVDELGREEAGGGDAEDAGGEDEEEEREEEVRRRRGR